MPSHICRCKKCEIFHASINRGVPYTKYIIAINLSTQQGSSKLTYTLQASMTCQIHHLIDKRVLKEAVEPLNTFLLHSLNPEDCDVASSITPSAIYSLVFLFISILYICCSTHFYKLRVTKHTYYAIIIELNIVYTLQATSSSRLTCMHVATPSFLYHCVS